MATDVIHYYIYYRIKKHNPFRIHFTPDDIYKIIRTTVRMPKSHSKFILREMAELKLIKRINHQCYILLKPKKDSFAFW